MATEIEDLIREYGTRFIKEQADQAEADLRAYTGINPDAAIDPSLAEYLKNMDIEVIYQRSPSDGLEHYRGLRRDGRWLADHFPAWPFEPDTI